MSLPRRLAKETEWSDDSILAPSVQRGHFDPPELVLWQYCLPGSSTHTDSHTFQVASLGQPMEPCALCPAFRSGRLRPGWQLRWKTQFQPFLEEWQTYRSNCTLLLSVLSAPWSSTSQSRSPTQNHFLSPSTLAFHVVCNIMISIKPIIFNYAILCIFNSVNENCGSVRPEKRQSNLEWLKFKVLLEAVRVWPKFERVLPMSLSPALKCSSLEQITSLTAPKVFASSIKMRLFFYLEEEQKLGKICLQNFLSSMDGPEKNTETRQKLKNAGRLSYIYICCGFFINVA